MEYEFKVGDRVRLKSGCGPALFSDMSGTILEIIPLYRKKEMKIKFENGTLYSCTPSTLEKIEEFKKVEREFKHGNRVRHKLNGKIGRVSHYNKLTGYLFVELETGRVMVDLPHAFEPVTAEHEFKAGDKVRHKPTGEIGKFEHLYRLSGFMFIGLDNGCSILDAPAAFEPVNARKFNEGDRVTKIKGSSWTGRVVGFYSTELTPIGYAVESETERGSVQIYPEAALQLCRS